MSKNQKSARVMEYHIHMSGYGYNVEFLCDIWSYDETVLCVTVYLLCNIQDEPNSKFQFYASITFHFNSFDIPIDLR